MNHDDLFEAACAARERAYAPYSKFLVGAALRTTDGDIFAGCNVENASYGGTVCAERVAIFNAVANLGRFKVDAFLLVTDTDPAAMPCGFCRQVMNEFLAADTPILIANLEGVQETTTLAELLPRSFGPDDL